MVIPNVAHTIGHLYSINVATIGFKPETPPIKLVLYQWNEILDWFWRVILSPLNITLNSKLQSWLALQFLACGLYARGYHLATSNRGSVLTLKMLEKQKVYLMYLWACVCITVFIAFAYNTIKTTVAELIDPGFFDYVFVFGMSGFFAVVVSSIMFFLFVPYYRYVYCSKLMVFFREQLSKSLLSFAVANVLSASLFIMVLQGVWTAEARLGSDFSDIGWWIRLSLAIVYLNLSLTVFLAALSIPRVLMATALMMALIAGLDKLVAFGGVA